MFWHAIKKMGVLKIPNSGGRFGALSGATERSGQSVLTGGGRHTELRLDMTLSVVASVGNEAAGRFLKSQLSTAQQRKRKCHAVTACFGVIVKGGAACA